MTICTIAAVQAARITHCCVSNWALCKERGAHAPYVLYVRVALTWTIAVHVGSGHKFGGHVDGMTLQNLQVRSGEHDMRIEQHWTEVQCFLDRLLLVGEKRVRGRREERHVIGIL